MLLELSNPPLLSFSFSLSLSLWRVHLRPLPREDRFELRRAATPLLPRLSFSAYVLLVLMAWRHLRDLLGEEQEPFAPQSFIDERQGPLEFREDSTLCKKSPLLSSSPSPAAILVGSASRVQKLGKRNRLFFRKRRKRKCSTDEDCPRSLGLGFLAFTLQAARSSEAKTSSSEMPRGR